jgi:type IV pilus assembly protein PilA
VKTVRSLFTRALARDRDESGFTLIELMVVVLIIAILIAIAIPTFLGARRRAEDRATQTDLRNALTAQKTFYTDKEVYAASTAPGIASLVGIEPRIQWMTKLTWSTGNATVGSGTAVDAVVCLQQTSVSGTTYAVADVSQGTRAGTYYTAAACPSGMTDTSFTGWYTDGWH